MDRIGALPEDCLLKILSLTSPIDVGQSISLTSKGFKSAADSDILWEAFLPSDYEDIISRSASSLVYTTKKELYLSLAHYPLMLDSGKMSFSLDKRNGNKCYLIAAKELTICLESSSWTWTPHPNSRFSEVAKLESVCWLDIRGKLQGNELSSRTNYAAYLVFQLAETSHGVDVAKAVVRLVNHETDDSAVKRANTLQFAQTNRGVAVPRRRSDGWLEVEMGRFYNERGDDGEVEARLIEIERLNWKSGLIVEGIEFRPL